MFHDVQWNFLLHLMFKNGNYNKHPWRSRNHRTGITLPQARGRDRGQDSYQGWQICDFYTELKIFHQNHFNKKKMKYISINNRRIVLYSEEIRRGTLVYVRGIIQWIMSIKSNCWTAIQILNNTHLLHNHIRFNTLSLYAHLYIQAKLHKARYKAIIHSCQTVYL